MAMGAIVHYSWLFIESEHPQELNSGRDAGRTMGCLVDAATHDRIALNANSDSADKFGEPS